MSTERKIWFAAAKKGVLEEIKQAIQDASFAKEKNFAIVDELGMCCVLCCRVMMDCDGESIIHQNIIGVSF